ncbi:MAG: C1 family peptidase [Nostoc sp.]|uniref:C1 family peptidase n=1 Tax=Nostoc sp. TaxID=1180 RepID=UPI002FFD2963
MPNFRMGWLPDCPDFRDYSIKNVIDDFKIQSFTATVLNDHTFKIENGKQAVTLPHKVESLSKSVDLREWCSPIEEQGNLKSCTAIAGVALIEYLERKLMGEYIDGSSLFLYKVARKLMHLTGDTGASIRFTMKAMALFGIPPEEYWPYDIETFDEEPPAFCYAYAQNYQALQYFRLDLPQLSKKQALVKIKAFLAAGFPAMFGFTAYNSIHDQNTKKTGKIPYPSQGEKVVRGHAVVAVGYDDNKLIDNSNYKSSVCCPQPQPKKGAFLIRNCWGENWGEEGYGWLPYEYVLQGLATDWWSLLKNEWIDERQFGLIAKDGVLLNGSSDTNSQKNPGGHGKPTDDIPDEDNTVITKH